jgi:hypothetical protein
MELPLTRPLAPAYCLVPTHRSWHAAVKCLLAEPPRVRVGMSLSAVLDQLITLVIIL